MAAISILHSSVKKRDTEHTHIVKPDFGFGFAPDDAIVSRMAAASRQFVGAPCDRELELGQFVSDESR